MIEGESAQKLKEKDMQMTVHQGGRWVQRMVGCALGAVALMVPTFGRAQMTMPGQFAVSPSGAATYSIPIQVPPGVAGMEPKLALVYNSQAGNGLLGVGWSLSGLSSITRCPRTMAQDGARGSVNYDTNDRYCLDGQRLIAVSGTDGANGTEYRTEQDAYSKVTSYSETGSTNGPGSFMVKTKSGLTMEFGKTEDSRIEAQGRIDANGHGVVIVWALNKVTDAKGNSYAVSYVESNVRGESYPLQINYTSGPVVTFNYEARPDITPKYFQGSVSKSIVHLKSIISSVGGTLLNRYDVAYSVDAGMTLPRITSITNCVASSCFPAIKMTYGTLSTQWIEYPNLAPPYPLYTRNVGTEGMQFVDINADGLVDLVRHLQVNGVDYKTAWLNTGPGWTEVPQYAPPYSIDTRGLDNEGVQFVDVNGDGLVDIVRHLQVSGTSYKTAWLNTGNGWNETPSYAPPYPLYTRNVGTEGMAFVDVNGDGLVDIVRHLQVNGVDYKTAWINTGSGWVETPQFAPPYSIDTRGLDNEGTQFVDVNGDGLVDIVRHLQINGVSYKTAWLNTGNGWLEASQYAPPYPLYTRNVGTEGMQFTDINGDGLPDIVRYLQVNGVNYKTAWLNTGSGWVEAPQYAPPYSIDTRGLDHEGIQVLDVDGDGVDDYVRYLTVGTSTYKTVWKRPESSPALVNIADGISSIAITYKSRGNGRVVAPEGNATTSSPFNLRGTGYVVAQVDRANGVSGNSSSSYIYGGERWAPNPGRGSLGFQWTQSKDVSTGLVSRTCYRQDWPYVGLVDKMLTATSDAGLPACGAITDLSPLTATGSNLLSLTVNSYKFRSYGPTDLNYANPTECQDDPVTGKTSTTCPATATQVLKRYQAYGFQSLTQSRDWDGSTFIALPASRTTVIQGNWGNVTQVKAETLNTDGKTASGYSKTTSNTYMPVDTSNWLLGRLQKSQVQAVSP